MAACVVPLQKGVLHAILLIAGEGVQGHGVDAVENAFFNVRVIPLQTAQQRLDLLPFGASAAVVTDAAVFGEAAGALDELELVVAAPGENIVLVYSVHGTDQLHALEVRAVELGQHGLKL